MTKFCPGIFTRHLHTVRTDWLVGSHQGLLGAPAPVRLGAQEPCPLFSFTGEVFLVPLAWTPLDAGSSEGTAEGWWARGECRGGFHAGAGAAARPGYGQPPRSIPTVMHKATEQSLKFPQRGPYIHHNFIVLWNIARNFKENHPGAPGQLSRLSIQL